MKTRIELAFPYTDEAGVTHRPDSTIAVDGPLAHLLVSEGRARYAAPAASTAKTPPAPKTAPSKRAAAKRAAKAPAAAPAAPQMESPAPAPAAQHDTEQTDQPSQNQES